MKHDHSNMERNTEEEAQRVFNNTHKKEKMTRKFEDIPEEFLEGVLL